MLKAETKFKKRGLSPIFLIFLLFSGCAYNYGQLQPFTAEPLRPLEQAELTKKCAAVYPRGKWQFVHSIEFSMSDGRGSSVVGVTVVDGTALSCALVTIEGFTLFEAHFTDRLEVDRAVPPFDKPEFAAGLMDDVRALFIRPKGADFHYGYLADNTESCRMKTVDGQVTDVLPSADGCWRIKTYNADHVLTRTIVARSCRTMDSISIPGELELTVPGPTGYTLKLTLINADNPAMENNQWK